MWGTRGIIACTPVGGQVAPDVNDEGSCVWWGCSTVVRPREMSGDREQPGGVSQGIVR